MPRGRGRRVRSQTPDRGEENLVTPEGIMDRIAAMIRPSDYRRASEFGAYKFSTTGGPRETYNWRMQMERALRDMELPADRWARVAVHFLDMVAYDWWIQTGVNAAECTWEQFVELFNDRHLGAAHQIQMREEFLSLRKGDNSILQYEQRFYELANYVKDLVRTEADRIYYFIRGLPEEYTSVMSVVPYESLKAAVCAASRREIYLHENTPQRYVGGRRSRVEELSPGPSKRTTSSSGAGSSGGSRQSSGSSSGSGHQQFFPRRDFRPVQSQFSGRATRPFQGTTSSQGGSSGEQFHFGEQYQRLKCYGCGSQDHLLRECPVRTTSRVNMTNRDTTQGKEC